MITTTDWAELWPDGRVLPVKAVFKPTGDLISPPPHAERGTKWVCRAVTYGDWEEWKGEVAP